MELTIDELNILIEAMQDWAENAHEETQPEVLKAILTVMTNGTLTDRETEALQKGVADWEGKKDKREETSVLIRARLIQARDKLVVQEAVDDSLHDKAGYGHAKP